MDEKRVTRPTVLNLPAWMTDEEKGLRVCTIGKVHIVQTPVDYDGNAMLGKERPVAIMMMRWRDKHVIGPLDFRDIQRLGDFKRAGGMKTDSVRGINAHRGDLVVLVPADECHGVDTKLREQPWPVPENDST